MQICSCLLSRHYGRISLNYPGSVRWQHFLVLHTDNIQKPTNTPDRLLCEVTQPSKSRV